MALPKLLNFFLTGHAAALGLLDRGAFIFVQDVHTRAPRFDFAGELRKLLLILLRPGTHSFQDSGDLFFRHDGTIRHGLFEITPWWAPAPPDATAAAGGAARPCP